MREPWKQAARGLQETVWEAPPSALRREDFWQVKLFNVTETQARRGLIDEHGLEAVYKWLHSQLARRKQQISLCQSVSGEPAEMNYSVKLLNRDFYKLDSPSIAALPIAASFPCSVVVLIVSKRCRPGKKWNGNVDLIDLIPNNKYPFGFTSPRYSLSIYNMTGSAKSVWMKGNLPRGWNNKWFNTTLCVFLRESTYFHTHP